MDEVHAVLGFAGGGGGDDVELFGAGLLGQGAEAAELLDGALDGFRVSLPVETMPRPRPASIFSLNSTVGERAIPS